MEEEAGQTDVATLGNLLVYERKFNVALRSSHVPSFIKKISDPEIQTYDIEIMRAHLRNNNISTEDITTNANVVPILYLKSLTHSVKHYDSVHQRIRPIIGRILRLQLSLYAKGLQQSCKFSEDKIGSDIADSCFNKVEIRALTKAHRIWTDIVDKLPYTDSLPKNDLSKEDHIILKASKSKYTIKDYGLEIFWSKSSVLMYLDDVWYMLPRSCILLFHNKLSDILSVLVLASSYPYSIYGTDCFDITTRFLRQFALTAIKLKTKFFKLSKILESIGIGITLLKTEGLGNNDFLNQLCKSLSEDIDFDLKCSELYDILWEASIPMLHELCCLSKTMGHPFCDMEKTANDLYDKVTEERVLNIGLVAESVNIAKKNFIIHYIRRHHEWPPVHIVEGAPNSLRTAHRKQVNPFGKIHQTKHGYIPDTAMEYVHLQRCEKFDKLENFLPYVKDRTISLIKRLVYSKYIMKEKDIRIKWTETRALLSYLFLPYEATEHISYLEMYAREDWEMMEDLLVIRLVPKEKEHKDSARCYGCKPAQERARTVVLGHNASKFLSKYSDSQAMTLSELALYKKLHAFRNTAKAYKNYEQFIVCLDASSWNSRQRDAPNRAIANAVLDPVHGTRYFSQEHEAYHHSYMYLPDIEKVYHWEGQSGGIEGQDQYFWVYSYVEQLNTIMGKFNYPYRLLVKGDDVRICVMIPPNALTDQSLDDIRKDVVQSVANLASQYGHSMKPEDSYGSSRYFAFSKNSFIDNVEMPQSFRKGQKAYGADNSFMTTVDAYASSSFSNCHSTSKVSPSPISCYILSLYWFLMSLLRNHLYKKLPDEELAALCILPNMLGGFSVIYLHNFYQRAESDLLSSFISIYHHASTYDINIYNILYKSCHQKILDPIENRGMLCIDPYCLPLFKPATAQSVLRTEIRRMMKQYTQNSLIKDLIEVREEGFQDQLMAALTSSNVISPKIDNIIFSSSPEGIVTELIAKFESGKSIMDAIILREGTRRGRSILKKAHIADKKLTAFRISLIKGKLRSAEDICIPNMKCPGESASILRNRLWCKRVESITQPPVYHTVLIGVPRDFVTDRRADLNHFMCAWDPPNQLNLCLFKEGKHQPFLGDSTGKGLTSPEARITTKDIFSIKVAKLLEAYRWCSDGTAAPNGRMSYQNLIKQMIERYIGTTIDRLIPFSGNRPFGRTVQHHVRANQFRPSIVPNTLLTSYTWFNMNTFSHHTLESTNQHRRLNINEVRCWTLSSLATPIWAGEKSKLRGTVWVVTRDCRFCEDDIRETNLHVRSMRLQPINFAGFYSGADALVREIHEEIEDFQADDFYSPDIDEDLDIAVVSKVICQYLLDVSYLNYSKLQDDHLGHAVSRQGMDNVEMWSGGQQCDLFSFRDLRHVDLNVLLDTLIMDVYIQIRMRFPNVDTEAIGSLIGAVPAISLPWYYVLEECHNAGLSRQIQSIMCNRRRSKIHYYDSHITYTQIFGVMCYNLGIELNMNGREIFYYTSATTGHIPSMIRTRMRNVSQQALNNTLLPLRNVRGISQDELTASAIYVICVCCRYLSRDYTVEWELDETNHALPYQYTYVNTDEFFSVQDYIEENDIKEEEYYQFLTRYMRHLPLDEVLDRFLDEDDDGYMDQLATLDAQVVRDYQAFYCIIKKTDLLSCKNTLKNSPRYRADIEPIHVNDTDMTVTIRHTPRGVFCRIPRFPVQNLHHNRSMFEELFEEFPVIVSPTAFNERWVLRLVGDGNISMSRYLTLFDQIGLRDIPDGSVIYTLADGYGGATRVLDLMTQRSTFIFITSPTTGGEAPSPHDIMDRGRNNSIDVYNIEVDRWDLMDHSNLIVTEQRYPYLSDIVLCDAEIIGEDQHIGFRKIWQNVSQLFLRNGKPGSLIILKIYLKFLEEVIKVIAMLRPYTRSLSLVQSIASSLNTELFLVGVLDHNNPSMYTESSAYPPVSIRTNLRRLKETLTYQILNDHQGTDMLLCSMRMRADRRLLRSLPSYGWNMLNRVARLGVEDSAMRIRLNETAQAYKTRIMTLFESNMDILHDEQSGNTRDRSQMRHLYSSVSHIACVQSRLFTIYGAFEVWNSNGRLIRNNIIAAFRSRVLTINRCTILEDHDRDYFPTVNLVDNYRLFDYYFAGVRWASAAMVWSTL